ncbi:hypothetical protein NBRC111894_3807 [Sporolactobacillus inulinus]|uniref:Uncharacterized protein n=1 Tax=Sporolactobacillus inulinus TaxID=2078 RepID=A0A4Y1ZH27_9BACL|nr:hypothetical protein NBRC111894_3807 [Sporolactobacillus inulinus]
MLSAGLIGSNGTTIVNLTYVSVFNPLESNAFVPGRRSRLYLNGKKNAVLLTL